MKCYAVPDEVKLPRDIITNGRYDHEATVTEELAFFERLREWLRKAGYNGPDSGGIVQFPVADSYASYMVMDGFGAVGLIHLPLGDAYSIPDAHMRGLTENEVREMVRAHQAREALFADRA